MITDASIRNEVRRRAEFRGEFCGISETDTGGELTIDHFHPKSKGGDDALSFTLKRLRLNRPPLVAKRLKKQRHKEHLHLLKQYENLALLLEKLLFQQTELIKEQQTLLKEQYDLLNLLMNK